MSECFKGEQTKCRRKETNYVNLLLRNCITKDKQTEKKSQERLHTIYLQLIAKILQQIRWWLDGWCGLFLDRQTEEWMQFSLAIANEGLAEEVWGANAIRPEIFMVLLMDDVRYKWIYLHTKYLLILGLRRRFKLTYFRHLLRNQRIRYGAIIFQRHYSCGPLLKGRIGYLSLTADGSPPGWLMWLPVVKRWSQMTASPFAVELGTLLFFSTPSCVCFVVGGFLWFTAVLKLGRTYMRSMMDGMRYLSRASSERVTQESKKTWLGIRLRGQITVMGHAIFGNRESFQGINWARPEDVCALGLCSWLGQIDPGCRVAFWWFLFVLRDDFTCCLGLWGSVFRELHFSWLVMKFWKPGAAPLAFIWNWPLLC